MFISDYYQVILTITILIVTFILAFLIGCREKKDFLIVILLTIWHTLFCIVYYIFTFYNAADSIAYYKQAVLGQYEFYPGSRFVVFLSSFFYQAFDTNYLNIFLIFNIFGLIGLLFFYKTLKPLFLRLGRPWFLILFIPSMSFWSSSLGKDSIVFLGITLFLYSVINNKLKTLFPISFFLIFMVRPHIALTILISYILYIVIVSKINLFIKSFIFILFIIIFYLSLGFIKQYVGLDDASLEGLGDYIDHRQTLNQGGGSSFDLTSMSYPMQMFTYIFRPLPFDAHSALALFTSIENTILLLLFSYTLYKTRFREIIEGRNFWLFTYIFLSCTVLSLTTANLGIATRQKWMFMPILIYLMVYGYYKFKYSKIKDVHI